MNNHSRPLGIFRREQFQTHGKVLSLIRPVITQWTAHYLSLRQLLEVEKTMQASWLKYGDEFIRFAGLKHETWEKAEWKQSVVMDNKFWTEVKL